MLQEINDQYIKDYIKHFKEINKKISKKSFSKEVIDYLENRYSDSTSITESLYRILNDINIRPICERCGKFVNFNNLNKGFNKHCCNSCAQGDPNVYNKVIQNKIDKYGTTSNTEKIKQTCLKKYGVEFALQKKEFQDKAKRTCLNRYGNENYRNQEKSKKTCLEKYGNEYYLNSNDCREKTIKKFGVDNYRKTEESKKKVSDYIKSHHDEIENKKKQTYIKHYGVDNPMKSDIIKSKFDWEEQKRKEYITKSKNNSFNSSKVEDDIYQLIKEKYIDVKRQYHSDLYPFDCDFYIPSLDLYIEYNGLWTHGGHPYNSNNLEDQKKLQFWIDKNTDYYRNAIDVWIRRDINKRNKAKENNLNYIEFWNINEVKEWLNK